MGFGVDLDKVVGTVQTLGEASAATGADLNSLAVVFGQVAGIGKLQGQDALQFINQGIPVYTLLSESIGKSVSQIKQMQAEGKITFDILKKAFEDAAGAGGRFENALIKQSKTLSGITSTLSGLVNNVLRRIGNFLLPAFKEVGTIAVELLGDVDAEFKRLTENGFAEKFAAGAVASLDFLAEGLKSAVSLFKLEVEAIVTLFDILKNAGRGPGGIAKASAAVANFAVQFEKLKGDISFLPELIEGFGDKYKEVLERLQEEGVEVGKEVGKSTGKAIIDGATNELSGPKFTTFENILSDRLAVLKNKLQNQLLLGDIVGASVTAEEIKKVSINAAKLKETYDKFLADAIGQTTVDRFRSEIDSLETISDKRTEDRLKQKFEELKANASDPQNIRSQGDSFLERVLGIDPETQDKIGKESQAAIERTRTFFNELLSQNIAFADQEIALQQNRVSEVSRLAEKGRTDLLENEEKKLSGLIQKRENALAQQRALASTEIFINSVVAASDTAAGIASAIGAGFPAALVAVPSMLALAAQVGSAVLSVSNIFSSLPGFAEGVEDTNNVNGYPARDGFLAVLHKGKPGQKGERVVDAANNTAMGSISNDELPSAVMAYRAMPAIERRLYRLEKQAQSNKEVVNRLERIEDVLSRSRVKNELYVNENGIGVMNTKYVDGMKRKRNLRG